MRNSCALARVPQTNPSVGSKGMKFVGAVFDPPWSETCKGQRQEDTMGLSIEEGGSRHGDYDA